MKKDSSDRRFQRRGILGPASSCLFIPCLCSPVHRCGRQGQQKVSEGRTWRYYIAFFAVQGLGSSLNTKQFPMLRRKDLDGPDLVRKDRITLPAHKSAPDSPLIPESSISSELREAKQMLGPTFFQDSSQVFPPFFMEAAPQTATRPPHRCQLL